MGKIESSKRSRGSGDNTVWSASDHTIRKAKQQRKGDEKQEERERRSALLTRDSKEKREAGKLRLHIRRAQRQIEKMRERLGAWDDEEEKRLDQKLKEEERKRQAEEDNPTIKKKGRLGPETWKLKGAARPAWQVYDFDVRYVDPYIKAHKDAKDKAQRSRNIFSICNKRFGEERQDVPQPHCRGFLSLLMQLGNLSMQANQLKSARNAFLECMELDSIEHPFTPARCQLMRMYVDANRPDSARRLWERLPASDPSVWIRYSAALIEFVSWKHLEEDGSTQQTAEVLLARAIKANIFCAYYLAYFDTFREIMDYVDEVEDAHEESPLEEAIEYCNSEQMGAWQGTEGACEWIKSVILKAVHGESVANNELSKSDLEWRERLQRIKEDCAAAKDEAISETDKDDDGDGDKDDDGDDDKDDDGDGDKDDDGDDNGDDEGDDDDDGEVDVGMFAGMFETAMEMIEDEDGFKKHY
jgi:tetratricopeptide (TPR) repeat protein